jgi:hypothetical protein
MTTMIASGHYFDPVVMKSVSASPIAFITYDYNNAYGLLNVQALPTVNAFTVTITPNAAAQGFGAL